MNNLIKALSVCALFGVLSTGCQKTPLYTPSVVATIGDHFRFSATGSTQVFDSSHVGDYGTTLAVVAMTYEYMPGTAVRLVISLYIPQRIGTYTINESCSARVMTAASGSGGSAGTSGTITVTGNSSGHIEGTFSLKCADGENVTAGQFYAPLPQ